MYPGSDNESSEDEEFAQVNDLFRGQSLEENTDSEDNQEFESEEEQLVTEEEEEEMMIDVIVQKNTPDPRGGIDTRDAVVPFYLLVLLLIAVKQALIEKNFKFFLQVIISTILDIGMEVCANLQKM